MPSLAYLEEMRRLTRSELRTFDDTWRHLPQAILPNPKTVSREAIAETWAVFAPVVGLTKR